MLIDLHAHSQGMSYCCKLPYEDIIEQSKEVGLDGIVLANHYQKSYTKDLSLTPLEYARAYVNEYEKAKAYAEKNNFKVFFAIEITAEKYPFVHLLVYGTPFDFLYENPEIYDMNQEELYTLVKSYGGALIHAHPYRGGTSVLDVNYLDGVELNCHPRFAPTHRDKLVAFAKQNGLKVTCGGDYHATSYRPKCGMLLPDDIENHIELGKYLLSDVEKELLVHEQDCETPEWVKVGE